MTTNFDGLGFEEEETPSEKLARENAEADIDLIVDLREARVKAGYTAAEFAKKLGVGEEWLANFESGMADLKLATVRRYAHALEVRITHSVTAE